MHTVEVEVFDIGDQHRFDLFFQQGGIQRHVHFGQRVLAQQVELGEILFERTGQADIRYTVIAIVDIGDLTVQFGPG